MKYLFLFISVVISFQCFAQESSDLEEYPVLKIAHETSLYRNDVDWEVIDKEYIRLSKEGKDSAEKLTYLLNALGDDHGTFRSPSDFQIIAHFTDYNSKNSENPRPFNSTFHSEVINNLNARFEFRNLGNGVGYLKVVSIGPQYSMEEDASFIMDGIKELRKQGISKWVLDLRYNGGGNMNPMLAGLSGLVGNGNIGGSCDKLGNDLQVFQMKEGVFYDTENLPVKVSNPLTGIDKQRVAVLLSQYTVSSGEMVAVAFKGRENTKFFGEKSGGLTTVTGYDFMNEDLLMLISKAYYRDRKGHVYMNGVDVDEKIMFVEYPEDGKDHILEASIKWLKGDD